VCFSYNFYECNLKKKKNYIFIFQITDNLEYDPKIGYTLRSPSVQDSGLYYCEAKRNNSNELRELTVYINRELVLLLTWWLVIECRLFIIYLRYNSQFHNK